jgi:chitinase
MRVRRIAAQMRSRRIAAVAAACTAGLAGASGALATAAAEASAQPIEMAAPYEYLGWGNPQPPKEVMAATGISDITLAFVLSHRNCNPAWEGTLALSGGPAEAAIDEIRAAGGEVDVSFGGWSGKKLGVSCKTAAALAGAYQKVINAYSLHAIDIDIEHTEFTSAAARKRVVAALAMVQSANPGIEISITFGTGVSGPERDGVSLISDAAAIGFQPSAWTIMPFDFGTPVSDMGKVSIEATEGLEKDLVAAYGISPAVAYQHIGISSMNGDTDESDETVSVEDFKMILVFAQQNQLARFTFWAVNRDRSCEGENTESGGDCSGISQVPYAYTDVVAQYHG